MKIKDGGALSNLTRTGKKTLETISVCEENDHLQMWFNEDLMSYLTLTEAIELRNELNMAIKEAAGV